MGIKVDRNAQIHPKANIDEACVVGPFCTIGPDVTIGKGTRLISHVVVDGHTSIGENCIVHPFVTLGVPSQDLKFIPGTRTYTQIGDRNIIREYVSIHSATEAETCTTLGDDCALLAHAHVAHNCTVGNHVVLSHAATLAGHVVIGDYANLGGLCAVHQFCHVGNAAMIAGMARVIQDVLPFVIAEGHPANMRVVNKVGMERAGYSQNEINEVRLAFRILFLRQLRLDEAVDQVSKQFGDRPHINMLLRAIETSQRGLARPESETFDLNTSE